MRIGKLAVFERCLVVSGMTLLTAYAGVSLYRSVASRLALREFDSAQAEPARNRSSPPLTLDADGEADFSLWSEKRIEAYRKSLTARNGALLAVLRLARLNIRVPVFAGTDEPALNRGVGWIPSTARPGEAGNIGIAGHRDGFFRPLKDATTGDLIELSTTEGTSTYMVDEIEIVTPKDVRVLQPRATSALTLVTCYPFYFVGDAPRRFIVHAALRDGAGATGSVTNRSPSSEPAESSKRREKK